jgi:ATP-dependent phosphofructokinase / diphosphate-dependent phosphofructokinase
MLTILQYIKGSVVEGREGLGTHCVRVLTEEQYGVMLAVQGGEIRLLPLEEVSGKKKFVSPDHPLVQSARLVSTCFGD